MNKEKNSMYCISCDIAGSTEPNFNCMMCCCQKCGKNDTECICPKNPDRHDWCRKCNSKIAKFGKCNCRMCLFCSEYKNETKWHGSHIRCYDCDEKQKSLYKTKSLCNYCKNEKTLRGWSKRDNCCKDCFIERICNCHRIINTQIYGYCYSCEYGEFL